MCSFYIEAPFSKLQEQYHTAMELYAEVQPWKVIIAVIHQDFSDAAVLSKYCCVPIWQLTVQERHNICVREKTAKSRSENYELSIQQVANSDMEVFIHQAQHCAQSTA